MYTNQPWRTNEYCLIRSSRWYGMRMNGLEIHHSLIQIGYILDYWFYCWNKFFRYVVFGMKYSRQIYVFFFKLCLLKWSLKAKTKNIFKKLTMLCIFFKCVGFCIKKKTRISPVFLRSDDKNSWFASKNPKQKKSNLLSSWIEKSKNRSLTATDGFFFVRIKFIDLACVWLSFFSRL